ncbi:cyclic nucleotide-binding protein [Maridesulfovibrio hydrothermalis]|uniref:Cyclic nucleotide-binding protein n=1 Tax=Maridesulfovibrio hydrothermalis AM13 = DSM 14728 TaxID=1121451 RepID=L0R9R0_9BACT|nr:cyclic nucleotide-binding protein [Maridesulfovibrio hydrothermalis]CCO22915.1 Cyclic nucleotide-binding protein [Maridesulfovibrio hydrothermalis AM13 = DSM 14728]
MRFSFSVKLLFLLIVLTALPHAAAASLTSISIGDFKDQSGKPAPEFKSFLSAALTEAGFTVSNSTKPSLRYTLSGLVKKNRKETSFSAMLSDNYNLEPEVFIEGRQTGGKNSQPAARQLAKSVTRLLSNQTITSIEVTGDLRLTPNAIMALAQILPGETASPEKVIAARIILENCGLFSQSQLYLTPGPNGRKLKISVKEKEMIIAGNMPGPGKAVLDNILGPPTNDLPEFPVTPPASGQNHFNANSTGYLAYQAGMVLEKFTRAENRPTPDGIEKLVSIAAAIRNKIYSYDKSCLNMCVILMKMCSVLDSKTVKCITEELQSNMEINSTDPSVMEATLSRIEFISQAYTAAREAQLLLASRLYTNKIHSPIIPWVLFSLGEQSLKAEDMTKAAPLLAGAISISSLPVAPEMLITTAKAQYSNLAPAKGDAATQLLRPLLAETHLRSELRKEIHELSSWASLCETVNSITNSDSFELQLKKGNALILLDRPDLAEPLFHELHSTHPDDARPFSGFARLAFQRTGNLLSSRPYIERAVHLSHKDRFFYEMALAYKLERITGEALPTINIDGRNSEEAAATRFLLPRAAEYAAGYKNFNKGQAALLTGGIEVLDHWLAYPSMRDDQALEYMFQKTTLYRDQMPDHPGIISANCYFSIFSSNRAAAKRQISLPLSGKIGLAPRFLQLNLLLREMALAPSADIAQSLEYAASSTFSDTRSRSEAVALQADALAVLGLYHNSTQELERAKSLYDLAIDLSENKEKARLLNNQACVYLTLGKKSEADDLYDESLDSAAVFKEAVELGAIMSSLTGEEQKQALSSLAETTESEQIKAVACKLGAIETIQTPDATDQPPATNNTVAKQNESPATGMREILLREESDLKAKYDNYEGLQLIFAYESNLWLLPSTARAN